MTVAAALAQSLDGTGAYLRLELPRALRNRRYVALAIAFPVVFYLLFTRILTGTTDPGPEARALFMVSMAAYGAIGAALSISVRVAMERASGWTRQLRVTPLPPLGYVTTKLVTAYLTALPSIALVMVAGLLVNHVTLGTSTWLAVFVSLAIGAVPFAALGVAIGYLFDESTAQLVFSVLFVGLALLGGLWIPASTFPEPLGTIARVLPSFQFANLGWSALGGQAPDLRDVLALAAYTLAFVAIVVWRYRTSEES